MNTIHYAVWKPEDQTDSNHAYVYAVCDTILDLTILKMCMTEVIITPHFSFNYRFCVEQLLDNNDEKSSKESDNKDENTTEVEIKN